MTTLRFDYQRECVNQALDETPHLPMDVDYDRWLIINIGSNEDPAKLKALSPRQIINCDLCERDQVLDHENVVDRTFDCARDRWPRSGRQIPECLRP